MKLERNMRRLIRITLTSAILLFTCACQTKNEKDVTREPVPIVLTKAQMQVRDATNGFSLQVFQKLVENRQKGQDVVFCPLSLSTALAMTAEGAGGQTKEQFIATMGLEQMDKADIAGYFEAMTTGLKEVDPSVHFDSSNSMWVHNGFSVQSTYKSTLSDHYHADIFESDFSSSKIVSEINKWVSNKTGGMINKMVESISPDAKLILLNALVFKGSWKFDATKSGKDSFNGEKGTVKKDYFDMACYVPYAETEDYQLFSLPYGNESYGMGIILPKEGKNLDDVISKLTVKRISYKEERDADIHFPMFSSSWKSYGNLFKNVLGEMGLSLPFTAAADFSGIHDGLMISDIIQQAIIDVTDRGTTFSAATEVEMLSGASLPPQKVSISVNRPFAYFVKEFSSGAILLFGTVSN